ncbi:MAG: hypothetical protein AB7U82_17750 [Blastocatellales bacterium]
MIRYSHLLKLTALTALCAVLSLSALAQKKSEAKPAPKDSGAKGGKIIAEKKPSAVSARLVIHEVTRNQAGATSAPGGKGLLVPVIVKLGILLPDTARLKQVEVDLVTRNTDGSTTPVKKLIAEDFRGNQIIHEIKLPMPNGVFAKTFTLKATATLVIVDEAVKKEILRTAIKSGSFPVEQKK